MRPQPRNTIKANQEHAKWSIIPVTSDESCSQCGIFFEEWESCDVNGRRITQAEDLEGGG